MATLKIDRHAAERIVAQVLRDELKLNPAQANEIALKVGIRMDATATDLLRAGYGRGWRAIGSRPPHYGEEVTEMVNKLRRWIPNADKDTIDHAWTVIYEYGREVPDSAMV